MSEILVQIGDEVRPATPEELAQRELDAAEEASRLELENTAKLEIQAKREELLSRLGLTEEEAKILLS